MIQAIKKKITVLSAALLVSAFSFGLAVPAYAQDAGIDAQNYNPNNRLCAGSNFNLDGPGTSCDASAGTGKLNNLITTIVNVLTVIIGIVAVIFIIVGGFKFITSSGDSGKVASARNTIIYALVGLIVVALAQVIVRFVLSKTADTVSDEETSMLLLNIVS